MTEVNEVSEREGVWREASERRKSERGKRSSKERGSGVSRSQRITRKKGRSGGEGSRSKDWLKAMVGDG